MRYLIWLVIALAVAVWFQRVKKLIMTGSASAFRRGNRQQDKPQTEHMVRCAHCGIYFPASEAITHASGVVVCSEEHLRLFS